ncbi:MAG: terminase gpA endonuclease subunit [Vicinamibacterales bacterium]
MLSVGARLDALVAAVMPALAPPPALTVSGWAELHRRLPVSSSAQGARWSNTTAPYLEEIQNATSDPSVRRLVVMGASQVGKSEAIHNVVGYWIEHDPSTVLWVMPSFEDAKRRARGAIADMIRSTPSLRAVVRGRRAPRGAHESESTALEKVYPGGSLILAGSGTPNSFAGVSARRAIADEFERFADLDEGAPDVLLGNRTSAFFDGLLVLISTPLLVDGKIDAQWKTTDQRRYHLRCEACGREDWVAWSDGDHFHVVYSNKDPETARLLCPGCGVEHDESARRRMVAVGRWLSTATATDRTARGYHLPAMISTLGDVTLSRLVQKWLSARAGGPAALLTFTTTTLAEPWEDRGGRVEAHSLAGRREDYGPNVDAPAAVVCLTAGVDVQIDRFEVQVIGWGLGGENWVVDAHVVPGDPGSREVQAALLAALDERYRHASGAQMPILITCVDSGYRPEAVAYELAARRPRRIIAVKGIGGRFGEPSILKFDPAKPPATLNVDGLKLEVALGLELVAPGPGYMHLNLRCCDEEYLAQLCAEHREHKRRAGASTMVWIEDRVRNEALDTAVYARAGLKLLARLSGARTEDSMLARMAAQLGGGNE